MYHCLLLCDLIHHILLLFELQHIILCCGLTLYHNYWCELQQHHSLLWYEVITHNSLLWSELTPHYSLLSCKPMSHYNCDVSLQLIICFGVGFTHHILLWYELMTLSFAVYFLCYKTSSCSAIFSGIYVVNVLYCFRNAKKISWKIHNKPSQVGCSGIWRRLCMKLDRKCL